MGIIWALKYAFAPIIIIDEDVPVGEAFSLAGERSDGYKMDTWMLNLALNLVNVLGLMALCVGFLVTVPMTAIAYVHASRFARSNGKEYLDDFSQGSPVKSNYNVTKEEMKANNPNIYEPPSSSYGYKPTLTEKSFTEGNRAKIDYNEKRRAFEALNREKELEEEFLRKKKEERKPVVIDGVPDVFSLTAEQCLERGVSFFKSGYYVNAIDSLDRGIAKDRKIPALFFVRALSKAKIKDLLGAVDDLSISVRLDPSYADAYYNRAIIRNKLGDTGGAKEDLKKAIELKPELAQKIKPS
jgi:tetratricopeptide (TPR) repeat protein